MSYKIALKALIYGEMYTKILFATATNDRVIDKKQETTTTIASIKLQQQQIALMFIVACHPCEVIMIYTLRL